MDWIGPNCILELFLFQLRVLMKTILAQRNILEIINV